MFWQMVTIQQSKLFKRAIFWVEVALLLVGAVLLHLLLYTIMQAENPETVSQMEEALTWPTGLINAMGFAAGPSLGGLIIIVLAGPVTAQAYTWRTLHLWLSRGVSRPLLMTAKFVALLLPALLVVLAPLMAGGITTAVFSQLIHGHVPFNQIHWGQLGLIVLRT